MAAASSPALARAADAAHAQARHATPPDEAAARKPAPGSNPPGKGASRMRAAKKGATSKGARQEVAAGKAPKHEVAAGKGPAHERASSKAAARDRATDRPGPASDAGYAGRPDVLAFIDEMVTVHGMSRGDLVEAFRATRFQARIVAAMDRPIVAPPKWFEYAPNFLNPARIDAGVAWWRDRAGVLARAEAQFGVPASIVVGIVGVETYFGRNVGTYRVIDALSTLAFDYPRRASFFRGELEQFLLFARDERLSPLQPVGSFAGAMGVPQFMPGSVRRFAVDFDEDGRVDLWRSDADVIGSIANYLARHDWSRGQPVLLPAVVDPAQRDAVLRRLDGGISERRALTAWNADGVSAFDPPADLAPDPVGLLLLEESPAADDVSLWIACSNFYVITRYNKSRLYAAAVWSLGEAVHRAYQGTIAATRAPAAPVPTPMATQGDPVTPASGAR